MGTSDMPHDELVACLAELANASLELWDVPRDAHARLINLSENATYLVEASGGYKVFFAYIVRATIRTAQLNVSWNGWKHLASKAVW